MKGKTANRAKVAVLMGGWSAEREVSLRTGAAVLEALGRLGHECWGIDVDRSLAATLAARRPDAAFIALHGKGGEDGAIQGFLETLGIPYTGSGVLASALAMNKKYAKQLFECHGIATPAWRAAAAGETPDPAAFDFGFPLVVKPVDEGSTIGISIVNEAGELPGALTEAWKHGREAIVEDFIAGRELTVGVLGGAPLPAVEIIPETGFYDYDAKYTSPATSYVVPAKLSPGLGERLAGLAVAASAALGCRGAVRVDFRVDENDVPFVLEVNTIPGMTDHSLLPKAALAAGLSYDALVAEILREALETP